MDNQTTSSPALSKKQLKRNERKRVKALALAATAEQLRAESAPTSVQTTSDPDATLQSAPGGGKAARARAVRRGNDNVGTKDEHRPAGAGALSSASSGGFSADITARIEECESEARFEGTGRRERAILRTDCHGSMISDAEMAAATNTPEDPLHCSLVGLSLRALPALPSLALHTLDLTSNELAELPALPQTLLHLNISRNWFAKLPAFPSSLKTLRATHNLLRNSGIGALPVSLNDVDLRFNQNLNKLTHLTALQTLYPTMSIRFTVTMPPPPDLYIGTSAAVRDPTLLRSQLEPWPTSALRRRIVTDFHGPALDEGTSRGEVMEKLLEGYEKEAARKILISSGIAVDEGLIQKARVIMKAWSDAFDNANEERTSVSAEHYMILVSPRLYTAGSRKAARAAGKVAKYKAVWDMAMEVLGSVDKDFVGSVSAVAVTHNFKGSPHIDKQNTGPFYAISVGDFENGTGGVEVECSSRVTGMVQTKNRLGKIDGRYPHWVSEYKGERWSLVFYRTEGGGEEVGPAIFSVDDEPNKAPHA